MRIDAKKMKNLNVKVFYKKKSVRWAKIKKISMKIYFNESLVIEIFTFQESWHAYAN